LGEQAAFGSVRVEAGRVFVVGERPAFLSALMYRMYCTRSFCQAFPVLEKDVTERQNERIVRAIERALAEGPFTIQQLAEESGISYDTLYSWVRRRRMPRSENVRQLASGLEKRADLLREIAEDLKGSVAEK
jgi:hypothetical protein